MTFRQRSFATRIAGLLLVAAIGVGCSDEDVDRLQKEMQRTFNHQLGVDAHSGVVNLEVPACFPGPITNVLVMVDGKEVWRIDSIERTGAKVTSMTIGELPVGFTEVRRLAVRLPEAEAIDVGAFPGMHAARARFTVEDVTNHPLSAACHTG